MPTLVSRTLRTAALAAVASGLVASGAHAATPKVTDLTMTGKFTLWVEPKPPARDEQWNGCIVEMPEITFKTADTANRSSILHFTTSVLMNNGTSWPLGGPLAFLTGTAYLPLGAGATGVGAATVLGFDGYRIIPPFPGATKPNGRVTLYTRLSYAQRWNGLNFAVTKNLPTRSAPLTRIEKPAGSCAAAVSAPPFTEVSLYA